MKAPRAKLKHVLLDVNLPHHHKVRALKRLHGVFGKCALYEAYAAMSAATNAIIDEDALLCIAEDNDVQDAPAWLKYCLDRGLIIGQIGGYSNQPVIDDQEAYARKLKIKPEDDPISPGKNPTFPGNNPGENPGKTRLPDIDIDNEYDSEFESKIKLVPPYDTPIIRRLFAIRHTQLKTIGRGLDNFQIETTCTQYHDPKKLEDDLAFTCSQSKVSKIMCHAPPSGANGARASPRKSRAQENQDATFEAMRQVLQEVQNDETR